MRWRFFLGPLVLVLLWALITTAGFVRPIYLPPPSRVFESLLSLLSDTPFWRDIGATLYRTIAAFVVSAVFGILLGVPLGVWRKLYESVEIVLDFFRSMPSPALIPLAMLLLGLGDLSRIAVAAFTCALVNTVQAAYAVRSVSRPRIVAARVSGAKGFFLTRCVLIPSIMPGLVAGWRITLSLSLIIVVVSEMFIGTTTGLGMRINDFHLMFRSTEMYASIIVVGVIGYMLNKLIEITEKHFVHWTGR